MGFKGNQDCKFCALRCAGCVVLLRWPGTARLWPRSAVRAAQIAKVFWHSSIGEDGVKLVLVRGPPGAEPEGQLDQMGKRLSARQEPPSTVRTLTRARNASSRLGRALKANKAKGGT